MPQPERMLLDLTRPTSPPSRKAMSLSGQLLGKDAAGSQPYNVYMHIFLTTELSVWLQRYGSPTV